jgi:probable F420-dependent oxidoreductase
LSTQRWPPTPPASRRIIVSDHVVFGEQPEAYADPKSGGVEGGRQPTGPDGHWLEPLTTLAFLAGQTERVRLGTSILLAALRRPVVLAKTAATLDVLSGGRLDLGVGVGWQKEEYEAAGLDFASRGRQLDHTLEVCRTLWTEERAGYDAPELSFDGIHAMPKPVQPGGVPVWVGGTVQPRAMERLARFGTGWIPWGPAVADPLRGVREMRQAMEDLGRDPATVQVTTYLRGCETTTANSTWPQPCRRRRRWSSSASHRLQGAHHRARWRGARHRAPDRGGCGVQSAVE